MMLLIMLIVKQILMVIPVFLSFNNALDKDTDIIAEDLSDSATSEVP